MDAGVVLMPVRMERRRREETWKTRMGNPRFGGHKKETTKKTMTKMWTRSKGRNTRENITPIYKHDVESNSNTDSQQKIDEPLGLVEYF
jgi:hypothetical protein